MNRIIVLLGAIALIALAFLLAFKLGGKPAGRSETSISNSPARAISSAEPATASVTPTPPPAPPKPIAQAGNVPAVRTGQPMDGASFPQVRRIIYQAGASAHWRVLNVEQIDSQTARATGAGDTVRANRFVKLIKEKLRDVEMRGPQDVKPLKGSNYQRATYVIRWK